MNYPFIFVYILGSEKLFSLEQAEKTNTVIKKLFIDLNVELISFVVIMQYEIFIKETRQIGLIRCLINKYVKQD